MLQKTPGSKDSKCGRRLNSVREFESLHLRHGTPANREICRCFSIRRRHMAAESFLRRETAFDIMQLYSRPAKKSVVAGKVDTYDFW